MRVEEDVDIFHQNNYGSQKCSNSKYVLTEAVHNMHVIAGSLFMGWLVSVQACWTKPASIKMALKGATWMNSHTLFIQEHEVGRMYHNNGYVQVSNNFNAANSWHIVEIRPPMVNDKHGFFFFMK